MWFYVPPGDSEMWRKRYFTLTKEFLFYSKSEQVAHQFLHCLPASTYNFIYFIGHCPTWYNSFNRLGIGAKEKGIALVSDIT